MLLKRGTHFVPAGCRVEGAGNKGKGRFDHVVYILEVEI